MNFNFPRTRFVDENGITSQVLHMGSEQAEIEQSVFTPDIEHTAEEVMDKLHSCETALRILQEKYGINLNDLRRRVERKNQVRNYYSKEGGLLMTWTEVTDSLPDSDMTVMTYEPDSCEPIWPGWHDGEQWHDINGGQIKPTHWMAFPEPPNSGG